LANEKLVPVGSWPEYSIFDKIMDSEQTSHPTPEAIARKRALEFLALSPTEKYDALISLIKITNEIRQSRKATKPNK
jgi:hypothetical protein